MPIPQLPSFYSNINLEKFKFYHCEFSEWNIFIECEKDYFLFQKIVNGLPNNWLKWTEKEVSRVKNQGIKINSPLYYRLKFLQKSIINLQECKYITDIIENSLRNTISNFIKIHSLNYKDLLSSIPDYKLLIKYFNKSYNKTISINSLELIEDHFILQLSFFQIHEMISNNWKEVTGKYKVNPSRKFGFVSLFWDYCRDVNKFIKDMTKIRRIRNDIAHSRRLFTDNQVKKLYNISSGWLDTLGINLKNKIEEYRGYRPNFLDIL